MFTTSLSPSFAGGKNSMYEAPLPVKERGWGEGINKLK
jgi:transcription initiation factor IIF auxiliary subunit